MKILLKLLAVLTAVALLTACGSQVAPTQPAETKPAESKPAETTPVETAPVEAASDTYLYLAGGENPVDDLILIDERYDDDGSFYRDDMTEDGWLIVCQGAEVSDWMEESEEEEYAQAVATSILDTANYDMISFEYNEFYTEQLTFPVYTAYCSTGSNEDLRYWYIYTALTEDAAYVYGLGAIADAEEDLESLAANIFDCLYLDDLSNLPRS